MEATKEILYDVIMDELEARGLETEPANFGVDANQLALTLENGKFTIIIIDEEE